MTLSAEQQIERHRAGLMSHCRRILGSPFDAEDAVQETMVRAWRSIGRFEGRAGMRTWLYSIATNVCIDMLNGRARRPRPIELEPEWPAEILAGPDPDGDPAELADAREGLRLALAAALRHLLPRQRAVLMLREVLRWSAAEAADLLDTSVASVNSALQRARATLAAAETSADAAPLVGPPDRELLSRYLAAFERHDMEALASIIREDAMRPAPLRLAPSLRAELPTAA